MKHITIVPYQLEWPQIFEAESTAIAAALGDNFVTIHHIGSTAVPGLPAKPRIDIIVVVKNGSAAIGPLTALGIEYMGEFNIPLHYGYRRRTGTELNIHVYEEGHPEIELNLCFRDYLRKHSKVRDKYAQLKLALAAEENASAKTHANLSRYSVAKGNFIKEALSSARFNRLRFLKYSDKSEWTIDPTLLNDPNHLHLILYEGANIIGYVHMRIDEQKQATTNTFIINKLEHKEYFMALIKQWLVRSGNQIEE